MLLQGVLSDAGLQVALKFAANGPVGTRAFEMEVLGGAVGRVPDNATAAANLRHAKAIAILRVATDTLDEAERGLQEVRGRREGSACQGGARDWSEYSPRCWGLPHRASMFPPPLVHDGPRLRKQ